MNTNDFNNQEPIIEMTPDERRSHKKVFSKISTSFVTYTILMEILVLVIGFIIRATNPALLQNGNFAIVLSSILQYGVAFPILCLLLEKVPSRAPEKRTLSIKGLLKYLVVTMFIMFVGNYISTFLMTYIEIFLGIVPENTVDTLLSETHVLLSILIIGIIGPIIEELMFRKLFIDRLTPYGEAVAVFLPALIFGLFHGNLYQFFYAFFIGVVFSYIYVKTGKISYTIGLHIFINLFSGVLPSQILSMFDLEKFLELAEAGSITEEYLMANALPIILLGIYEFLMLGMVFLGIFTFTRNIRNISFNKGEIRLPKGHGVEIVLGNVGTAVLIAICVVTIAISTFAV